MGMTLFNMMEGIMSIVTTNRIRISGSCAMILIAMLMATLITAHDAIAAGPAAVNIGSAANFAALAKTGISTTGTTSIVGDIGVSPAAASYITGFALSAPPTTFSTSPLVTGKVYAADYDPPTPSNMTTAVLDMQNAYTDAAGRTLPTATELGAGNISGMTLAPGLYKWGTGLLIDNTGVTLSGSADDVWIFQIAETLTVSSGAIVTLSGGAQVKNIFWQVAGQTTLGTTSQFKGNILDQTAIVMNTGARLDGRALAQTEITLDANTVIIPVAENTPEPAAKLVFGVQPSTTTAGGPITPAVTVRIVDANNILVTSDTRNVTLAIATSTGIGILSGTTTVAASGGIATFSNLSIDIAGTGYSLSATSSPALTGATSNTFEISPGVLHHFTIGAISSPRTAGSAFSVTVTAQDANNNMVTSFAGTVGFATNAGTITPAVSNNFLNGQLTQNVTVTQAGTGKTITVVKSGGSETGTSNTIAVDAGQATKLAFGVQPGSNPPGGTITPAVTVRILDENDNLVTNDTRDVSIAINPGGGTLSGTTTVAASGGIATFSNLSIDITGTGYSLSATSSPALTGATSNTFDIKSIAPPTNLVVADVPADNGHSLSLTWTISTDDASLIHYYIYRSRMSQISDLRPEIGTYTTIEALIEAEKTTTILIAKVPRGTSSYTDTSIPLNGVTYYYWLQSVAESGASKLIPAGIVAAVGDEPRQFMVGAPYPNPFNSSTAIEYVLPETGKVTVAIYNTIGQAVYSFDLGYQPVGSHRFVFRADGLTSGMYFFRIDAGYAQSNGKLLYMK